MGDHGKGVEARPSSIRLHFTWEGKPRKVTLTTAGAPMLPTPRNLRYAAQLVAEIRERIRLGTFAWAEYFPAGGDTGTAQTLGSLMDTWLAAQRIEASTRAGYESAIRFWKAAKVKDEPLSLGEVPLRALRHSHFTLALATRPSLSGKTVNNYVSVAREALDLAVADKLLAENPAAALKRAKHQAPPPDPFSADEREAIIGWMRQRAPAQVANLVDCWFWTGMRTSEVFGLRWPSVDLRAGEIMVHEALVRGEEKSTTKTAVARLVKLNGRARAALEQQKAHTLLAGAHVFLDSRYGTAWTEERAFRRSYWEPCLKSLGIRYRRPYNMRHTYATAMLMAPGGMMNPAFCARQLGHSVKLFLDTYSKWIEGQRDDAEMARLDPATSPELPRHGRDQP